MKLDVAKAYEVIDAKIASQLNVPVLEAALAIRDKVDMYMGQRAEDCRRGPWLRLFAGYGDLRWSGVLPTVAVLRPTRVSKRSSPPRFASVFSANSLSSMDIWHIYSRRLGQWVRKDGMLLSDFGPMTAAIEAMSAEAARDMRGEGFADDEVTYLAEAFVGRTEDGPEGRVTGKSGGLVGEIPSGLRGPGAEGFQCPPGLFCCHVLSRYRQDTAL